MASQQRLGAGLDTKRNHTLTKIERMGAESNTKLTEKIMMALSFVIP